MSGADAYPPGPDGISPAQSLALSNLFPALGTSTSATPVRIARLAPPLNWGGYVALTVTGRDVTAGLFFNVSMGTLFTRGASGPPAAAGIPVPSSVDTNNTSGAIDDIALSATIVGDEIHIWFAGIDGHTMYPGGVGTVTQGYATQPSVSADGSRIATGATRMRERTLTFADAVAGVATVPVANYVNIDKLVVYCDVTDGAFDVLLPSLTSIGRLVETVLFHSAGDAEANNVRLDMVGGGTISGGYGDGTLPQVIMDGSKAPIGGVCGFVQPASGTRLHVFAKV